MTFNPQDEQPGKIFSPGSRHYRAFIGPAEKYDLASAMQFNLLTFLGLREHHFLLDIGCGSLRGGKLFIPYLLPGRYFGTEPESWLIEEGIRNELGDDIVRIKKPVFSYDKNYTLTVFDQKFDFILAQSIFSHAPRQQIVRCLSEAKKTMKPDAIFAATFEPGDMNYTGDKWVYPECVSYTLEHMTGLVKEQGLVCQTITWPHPNLQTWIVIVNPGCEKNIPDPSDITEYTRLENDLKYYQSRLARSESHPYVKFGKKINLIIQRLKRWKR